MASSIVTSGDRIVHDIFSTSISETAILSMTRNDREKTTLHINASLNILVLRLFLFILLLLCL